MAMGQQDKSRAHTTATQLAKCREVSPLKLYTPATDPDFLRHL